MLPTDGVFQAASVMKRNHEAVSCKRCPFIGGLPAFQIREPGAQSQVCGSEVRVLDGRSVVCAKVCSEERRQAGLGSRMCLLNTHV